MIAFQMNTVGDFNMRDLSALALPKLMTMTATLLMLTSSVIFAKSQPSSQRIKEAQKWIEVGQEALQQQSYESALFAYEQAERHHPSLNHLMLIAHVHSLREGGCEAAIKLWEKVLLRADEPTLQQKVQKKLDALRLKCRHTLIVESQPPGAKVWVDQELMGFSPLTFDAYNAPKIINASFRGEMLSQEVSQRERSRDHKDQPEKLLFTFDKDQSGASPKVDSTKELKHAPLKLSASITCRARLSTGDYERFNSCENRVLWEDDQFYVNFHADQPTYIYVLLSNKRGQHQMIFPQTKANNLLAENQKARLPTRGWFTLDDVGPVDEVITIVYSRDPVGALEKVRGLDIPPLPLSQLKRFAMRGIKQTSQAEPQLSATTTQKNRDAQYIGFDQVNQIQFTLRHEGARPLRSK